jgi:uncharacterized protein
MRACSMQILDREECLALLSTVPVGRVAWAAPGGPINVLPVNFTFDGDCIVFRLSPGGTLEAIEHGMPLAFEVDDMEPAVRTGWSILLNGNAEIVSDPGEARRLEQLAGAPWPDVADPVLVRFPLRRMSGRRLPLHEGGVVVEYVEEEEP